MASLEPLTGVVALTCLADTEALAGRLARHMQPGSVVALVGDLGAGKTTLVQALARELGVHDPREVVSPTYALMHEYDTARGPIVHVDFYRLQDEDSAIAVGLEEALARPDAFVLLEWADRLPTLVPKHAQWVTLELDAKGRRAVFA